MVCPLLRSCCISPMTDRKRSSDPAGRLRFREIGRFGPAARGTLRGGRPSTARFSRRSRAASFSTLTPSALRRLVSWVQRNRVARAKPGIAGAPGWTRTPKGPSAYRFTRCGRVLMRSSSVPVVVRTESVSCASAPEGGRNAQRRGVPPRGRRSAAGILRPWTLPHNPGPDNRRSPLWRARGRPGAPGPIGWLTGARAGQSRRIGNFRSGSRAPSRQVGLLRGVQAGRAAFGMAPLHSRAVHARSTPSRKARPPDGAAEGRDSSMTGAPRCLMTRRSIRRARPTPCTRRGGGRAPPVKGKAHGWKHHFRCVYSPRVARRILEQRETHR